MKHAIELFCLIIFAAGLLCLPVHSAFAQESSAQTQPTQEQKAAEEETKEEKPVGQEQKLEEEITVTGTRAEGRSAPSDWRTAAAGDPPLGLGRGTVERGDRLALRHHRAGRVPAPQGPAQGRAGE